MSLSSWLLMMRRMISLPLVLRRGRQRILGAALCGRGGVLRTLL